MDNLLVIEDSKFFLSIIQRGFEFEQDIKLSIASSLAEATELISNASHPYSAALVDLRLPDAHDGEAVDLTIENNIPTIVFTSNFDDDTRERFLDKGALDFVLKDNPSSLDYLQRIVRRVIKNRVTKVLVVDDSSIALRLCSELLEKYQLIVFKALSGEEALKVLESEPDIKLIVTDNEMPGINGVDLVAEIRRNRRMDELAIIGVSGSGGATLSAKFLKHGANDFITKPYLPEELYTRIAQNLEILENVELLTIAATRDFLTGIYNRRSFFDLGSRLLSARRRSDQSVAVAMLDIDHFKKVNDTFGHDAGDYVLKGVSDAIEEHVARGSDLCARLGGEEFAILIEANNEASTLDYFDKIRSAIEAKNYGFQDNTITVTASLGVVMSDQLSLEQMLASADELLYRAKNEGRNRVCFENILQADL